MYENDSPDGGTFALVYGGCVGCGQTFAFNPHRVPSVMVNGTREPVCSHCMGLVNRQRVRQGLTPHSILPGAYDPIPISEL